MMQLGSRDAHLHQIKLVVVMVREDESPEGFYKLIKDLRFDKLAWQDDARCRGLGNDLFFPEQGASTEKAKGICEPCKVKTECLDYAVDVVEKFGIWGGLSERERRPLRRERAVKKKQLAKAADTVTGARLK